MATENREIKTRIVVAVDRSEGDLIPSDGTVRDGPAIAIMTIMVAIEVAALTTRTMATEGVEGKTTPATMAIGGRTTVTGLAIGAETGQARMVAAPTGRIATHLGGL